MMRCVVMSHRHNGRLSRIDELKTAYTGYLVCRYLLGIVAMLLF